MGAGVIMPRPEESTLPSISAPNFSFNPGPAVSTGPAEIQIQKQQQEQAQQQNSMQNILHTTQMASQLVQSFVEMSKQRQQRDAIQAYASFDPTQPVQPGQPSQRQLLARVLATNPSEAGQAIINSQIPKAPTSLDALIARQVAGGQNPQSAIQAKQETLRPQANKLTTVIGPDGTPQVVSVSPTNQTTPIGKAAPKLGGNSIGGRLMEQQFPDGSIHNMKLISDGHQIDEGIKKLAPGAVPTTQDVNTSHFAQSVLPHISDLRNLIEQADQKGYIGPAAGRLYQKYLTGEVGSTGNPDADKLLGDLKTTSSLIASGALRTHFGARGGQQMYEQFTKNLNTATQSKALLNGELDGFESFLSGYSHLGQPVNANDALKASVRKKLGL